MEVLLVIVFIKSSGKVEKALKQIIKNPLIIIQSTLGASKSIHLSLVSIPKWFHLVPRLVIYLYFFNSDDWKCLKFDFKVGDATRRAQKCESCSPPRRLCRGLRDSNPIPLDWAQKVGPETLVTQHCKCIISYQPILDQKRPTRIELNIITFFKMY